MAQDFNLADDLKIRIEQALAALSEARDAIDGAEFGLRDALYSVQWSQRQEREAREAAKRAELQRAEAAKQRDRFLLLCANALGGFVEGYRLRLSRHHTDANQSSQATDAEAASTPESEATATHDAQVLKELLERYQAQMRKS